ncbi:MAG: hypothetical protein AB7D05_01295, partial [Mangrovibacterium sp.]
MGIDSGKNWFGLLLLLPVLLLVASCSSTRFVPEGEILLNKVDVRIDNRQINRGELKAQIRQKENLRILGFLKFHLAMYNLSSGEKENDWFKRIGEEPVVYREDLTKRSREQLELYLRNKGYYNARIRDTLLLHSRKPKGDLFYLIQTGQPYRIRNYRLESAEPAVFP